MVLDDDHHTGDFDMHEDVGLKKVTDGWEILTPKVCDSNETKMLHYVLSYLTLRNWTVNRRN
jgi:hypothetical protein